MKVLRNVFLGIVFAILYAPIFVMILFSFNSVRSPATFRGFSVKWYGELFSDRYILKALLNTLNVSIGAAIFATVLGVIAAYGIYKIKSKFLKKAVNTVTNIPLTNPDIITGLSFMLLFTFVGIRFFPGRNYVNFYTLLIAHVTFDTPYVILNILPRLNGSDPTLYEAAMDLGCTKTKAFWKIVFPGIVPGIISGFIMAFTLSIDDFIISFYTRGTFEILGTKLYTAVKRPVSLKWYALCTLIFLVTMLLMTAINVIEISSENKKARRKK